VDISRAEFYTRLVESEEPPKTAAPAPGMFAEVFERLAAHGHEILSLSLAAGLSGTYNAARQGAALVEGARIACVDSGTVTMPMGFLALAAARAIQAGQSLDQAVALVETRRSRAALVVGLQTLHYLEKGGRIGRMRALLGTMLNFKPIIDVREGEVYPIERPRTWKRVPARMVELMQSRGSFEDLAVLYTTTRDTAEQLADQCADAGLMARDRILVVQASAALGVHTGPGALGIGGILKD
jgi:DegV family protein with EDD domain